MFMDVSLPEYFKRGFTRLLALSTLCATLLVHRKNYGKISLAMWLAWRHVISQGAMGVDTKSRSVDRVVLCKLRI